MIEKIKGPLDLKVGNYKGTEFDIIPAETFAMVCRKINEIIDLLNAIVVDVDGIKCIDGSKKAEPTDPYAEQRRWIGKLCKFWDEDERISHLRWGILYTITPTSPLPFCCSLGDGKTFDYKHCEPVKPDDDIIYKGV